MNKFVIPVVFLHLLKKDLMENFIFCAAYYLGTFSLRGFPAVTSLKDTKITNKMCSMSGRN